MRLKGLVAEGWLPSDGLAPQRQGSPGDHREALLRQPFPLPDHGLPQPAGGTAAFGFTGAWTATNTAPADFTLNGTRCSAA
jgi:hypothetical protein